MKTAIEKIEKLREFINELHKNGNWYCDDKIKRLECNLRYAKNPYDINTDMGDSMENYIEHIEISLVALMEYFKPSEKTYEYYKKTFSKLE
jgi:hypothetical protein